MFGNCGQHIILASASPRRGTIFGNTGFQVEVIPADVTEEVTGSPPPEHLVEELSLRKAAAVATRFPRAVVVGADTVVALEGRILSKPASPEEAVEMLTQLSGRWHTVFTGFTILKLSASLRVVEHVSTRVKFQTLSAHLIQAYVATGEPLDKAGAYGIQGLGALLVEKLEGCYFNVMGFPISAFHRRYYHLFCKG